jgi:hypothetical protein
LTIPPNLDPRSTYWNGKAAGTLAAFRPGEPVQQAGRSEELIVEGYDPLGRVICSYWAGISRAKAAFQEAELRKVAPPW